MTTTPRPAEFLHSSKCLAHALVCAIENIRDLDGETDLDFRLSAQDNYFLTIADEYLVTGTVTCLCPDDKVESFADACTKEA